MFLPTDKEANMSEQEIVKTDTTAADRDPIPQNEAPVETTRLNRRARSVDDESAADRKRGHGGLDSLGMGNIL
jgi:hypothetical protein